MALTRQQEKKLLAGLLAALVLLVLYRVFGAEPPRTRPLVYTKGMTVSTPVRMSRAAEGGGSADPLALYLERRSERYPGVSRDLFRMQNPEPVRKPKPRPKPVVTAPTPTVPVRSPEEIAADQARADLSRFRFLGYLTDKDSSLFLSKDGELFIVKSGDRVLKNYEVKSVGKDYVILYDTITKVEARIELTGGGR